MYPAGSCFPLPFLIAMLTAAGLTVAGCDGINKDVVTQDPVASYKTKVQEEISTLRSLLSTLQVDDAYKINVVKSDSLVSPLVGTCQLVVSHPITLTSDGKKHTGSARFQVDLTHGLQDGDWTLTSCRRTFLAPAAGDDWYIADILKRVAGTSKEDGGIDKLAGAILSECTPKK
jgi:hypothetical protein